MKANDQIPSISDEMLISEAVLGNKKSLEILIKRYQDYVYNISLRLFLNPDDALDATQEVLIKVVTHLKTFNGKSQFKTWLYRIAINYFLNAKTTATEIFMKRGVDLSSTDLIEENDKRYTEQELEEVRLTCSTGMLQCLNRDQRLIYIIGEIFGADHKLGAELFDTTPANYRVLLHRAKTDLLNYVSGRCGLVDPKNSCRCSKKARVMIEKGFVDRKNIKFTKDFNEKVNQIVVSRRENICDDISSRMTELFQDSPFQVKKELDQLLSNLV